MPQWNPRDGICSGCGEKFRRSGAFDDHVSECPRNLLGPKTPQWNPRDGVCSGCGEKFRRSGAFEEHVSECPRNLLSHSEEYPKEDQIKCPTCQTVMWSYDELQRHTKDNHQFPTPTSKAKKGLTCSRCHTQFGSRNALFSHLNETGHAN